MKVGVYLRISSDPLGDSLAIDRQREDCNALAQRLGFEVVEYVDRDLSAYKRKVRRPGFEQMLADVASGAIGRIMVYRLDRLVRQPRDLERVVDVLEDASGELLSVTEPQFTGSAGLLMMRILVAFANNESSVKAERVARAYKHLAEQGEYRTHGRRHFGFELDGTHNEAEAQLVREAVGRVVNGESLPSVRADWAARGVRASRGGELRTANIAKILTSPKVAGLAVYQGKIIGRGKWEPIVPEEQWRTFVAMLEHEVVPRAENTTYLLSGIACCGRCGTRLFVRRWGTKLPTYYCRTVAQGGCGGVSIGQGRLDDEVAERVLSTLDSPETGAALLVGPSEQEAVLGRLSATEARLSELSAMYADGDLSKPEWQAARSRLLATQKALKAELGTTHDPLAALGGAEVIRTEWGHRSVPWRRSVVAAIVDRVHVDPVGRSNVWNPERVRVTWKV